MKTMDPFAVNFSGIHLVEASAGTGKTYNITSLYIRALIALDITVGNILVVTYTEAATKELKDRLLQRIRESIAVLKRNELRNNDEFLANLLNFVEDRQEAIEQLEQAVRTFDEAAIHTIHGFCYQALQEQAFESGAMYDAEMIGDDAELVIEATDDFWRKWVAESSDDPLKRPLLQYLLDNNCNPDELARELTPHLGQPFLEIYPRQTQTVEDMGDELSALSEVYEAMRDSWKGEQQRILSLLQADQLNGNKYRKNSLPGWIDQIDDFLGLEVPRIQLCEYFHKFTASTLRKSLKKGYTEIPQHPFFKLADEYQQIAESLQNFEVGFKKKMLLNLRKELWQKKEDLQVLSYDDLLLRLQYALKDNQQGKALADKLRAKYPLALVDEFQDTDPCQYDIFRRIYSDKNSSALFMIGDPKQSIYSFRGADVFSYLKARRDAPKKNTHGLGRNFRSVPELIKGLNKLFGEHSNPFIIEKISFQPVKAGKSQKEYNRLKEKGRKRPPIQFRKLKTGDREKLNKGVAEEKAADDTATEVARLINDGEEGKITIGDKPVKAKDIAILVRTHRQASQISDVLQEKGIKSVQYSQQSVFESDEARQLQIFLNAVAEPANERLIKTALSLPLISYKADQLLGIEEDEELWLEQLNQFRQWHQLWQTKGFSAIFRSVLQEAYIAENLIKFQNGERRLTNLLHLGELLQEEARRHRKGTRGLLKWFARKRDEENGKQEEEQLRLESDEELVKVVTMHRSKGLEYPIVFCPYLWHGPKLSDYGQPLKYHDPDELDTTYLDLNGKDDPDRDRKRWLMEREELAESLRLAYVAMTRAEQRCYLTWVYAGKSEFSPLGYLLQDSDVVLKHLRQTISKKYSSKGAEIFNNEIERLCNQYSALFTISTDEQKKGGKQLDLLSSDKPPKLSNQTFRRATPLELDYHISSFSSLTSWMEEDPDMPDYDQFLNASDEIDSAQEQEERSIFTFPRGPEPGTCIHKIFEEVDFQNPNAETDLIIDELSRYGIDLEWREVVGKMLHTVTGAKIHPQNKKLTLGDISAVDMVQEMEFYYQNKDISSRRMLAIIRDELGNNSRIHGRAPSGFLKGFIDLTFRFDGKYYLLDYKTNYLGDCIKDYRHELLKEEMQEASYDLQYHIYTVALHRFLKKAMPEEYSYEEHFGGAFYLFVRGMNDDGREGIFFDRPQHSVIKELDEYIRTGGRDA